MVFVLIWVVVIGCFNNCFVYFAQEFVFLVDCLCDIAQIINLCEVVGLLLV